MENTSSQIPPVQTPPPSPQETPKIAEIEKIKQTITTETTTKKPMVGNIPTMPSGMPSNTFNNIINFLKNPKLIIGIIISIVLIAVGTYFYRTYFYNIGQLTLIIDQNPDSIMINEKTYDPTNQLNLDLKPGTYTINLTKNLFFPVQTSFTIQPQQTTKLDLSFQAYPSPIQTIDFPTSFPHLTPDQNEISYLSNFGTTFYRINLQDYTKDVISPNTFNNIDDIFWAPTAKKACIIKSTNTNELKDFQTKNILYQTNRPENSTIFHFYDFSKYDLTSQTHIVYSDKIKNPSWHPTKEEIIYHYTDLETGENSLSKSKPNLNDKELLYDLKGLNNAIVKYSPNTELIAIVDTEPTDRSVNNIYLFDTISRQFEKIPTKNIFTNFIWSPDSQYLAGIKSDLTTSLINISTLESIDMPFNADINHMAWLNNSTGLLVSVTGPNTMDEIILYDIISGEPNQLAFTSDIEFDTISHPIISRDDSQVYFVANDKNHLYSLEIQTMPENDTEILTQ